MFHFTERRIDAHVGIWFIAYKVYKELERQIAISRIGLSVDHVLDAAKAITTIRDKDAWERDQLLQDDLFLSK